MAILYIPALIAARRCCSASLFPGCRVQDVHGCPCRRPYLPYISSGFSPGTSCGPIFTRSALSWRQKEGYTVREAQRRAVLISGCTMSLSAHDVTHEDSSCERTRTDSRSPELPRDANPLHTKLWWRYASLIRGNWFFFFKTEHHLRPFSYEPRTRSLSFVGDRRGTKREAANEGTVLSLTSTRTLQCFTGAGTHHGSSCTSNFCGAAHLRLRSSTAAMPVLRKVSLSLGRGHSGDLLSLVFATPNFCSHDQPVQHPLVQSQWQLSVAAAKVNLHGAARDPGLHKAAPCICNHCKTAVPRQLDILCRSCGRVLQPRYDNYKHRGYSFFDLLELKPDFAVDPLVLDAKYRKLQKELHPDKNLNADEEGRIWNEEHRKQIVLAVATLRCPARRALHLLQHHFHCLPGGEEKEELERVTDSDLLTEVLELNEVFEEVRTRDELDTFEKKIQGILQADEKALAATFREKDVEGMRKNAQRYMMHAGLMERIKNWSAERNQ